MSCHQGPNPGILSLRSRVPSPLVPQSLSPESLSPESLSPQSLSPESLDQGTKGLGDQGRKANAKANAGPSARPGGPGLAQDDARFFLLGVTVEVGRSATVVESQVRVWRPARQPVFHPKKQRPFLGDPGLETGATGPRAAS
jgi:hypothetical protein